MVERAQQLEDNLKRMIVHSYNSLVDKEKLQKYFTELFIETAYWMSYKGRDEYIRLLKKGKISEQALSVVLILRLKSKGDNTFTTLKRGERPNSGRISLEGKVSDLNNGNQAFRAVIGTGPFFDYNFDKWQRYGHGAYTHILQRDIVSTYALPADRDEAQKFWDYLSTPKGVAFWADLFDSDAQNFTRPEKISEFIMHYMGENTR